MRGSVWGVPGDRHSYHDCWYQNMPNKEQPAYSKSIYILTSFLGGSVSVLLIFFISRVFQEIIIMNSGFEPIVIVDELKIILKASPLLLVSLFLGPVCAILRIFGSDPMYLKILFPLMFICSTALFFVGFKFRNNKFSLVLGMISVAIYHLIGFMSLPSA